MFMTLTGLGTVAASIATLGLSNILSSAVETGVGLKLLDMLPLYITVPTAIVINSFAAYWCHRAMHAPFLSRFHAVHHAGTDFNSALTFRNHPVDSVIQSSAVLFTVLLGFSNETIVIALMIIYANAIYCHSDLPTSAILQRWVLFGPHGHGIHHGNDPVCFNTNFGNLVFWDRLFGTYKTDVPSPLVYGCADPEGVYQSGRPLRDMIAVQALWLSEARLIVKSRWPSQIVRVVRGAFSSHERPA